MDSCFFEFSHVLSFSLLADVVFTTAHKAKGLEFEKVKVTDDFLPATRIGRSSY